jgi:hypothetical protein
MKPFVPWIVFLSTFFLSVSSSAQNYTRGTAILAIRTPGEIAVAADSREVGPLGLPNPAPVCKIRQIDRNIFLAAYGLYEEKQSGYNFWEMIRQAGRGFNTVTTMADSFEAYARAPLEKALKQIRLNSPEFYKEKCLKSPPLGVIFFGFEDDILVFKHRKVSVYDPASANIWVNFLREDCPGPGCPDGYIAVAVAEEQEIGSSSPSRNTVNIDVGIVAAVRNFITTVISNNPVKYGPPIDILYINKEGAKWVQKKAECSQ